MSNDDTHQQNEKDKYDDLSAFRLRARTREYDFKHVWKCMQKNNWKYITSSAIYSPPPELNASTISFKSGNDVEDFLDRSALQPVSNASLEAPPSQLHQLPEQDTALRNGVIDHLHHMVKYDGVKPMRRRRHHHNGDDNGRVENEEEQPAAAEGALRRSTRVVASSSAQNKASVTCFEPGADLYITRKRKAAALKRKSIELNVEPTKLDMPLPSNCAAELLKDAKSPPDTLTQSQLDEYTFLLGTNHSLLFYGFGSKRHVLNSLATHFRRDGDVLTIDGYDREVCMDGILDIVVNHFLDGKEPPESSTVPREKQQATTTICLGGMHKLVKRAVAISRELRKTRKRPIFLVVHNADGVGLRHVVIQQALAALVVNSMVAATGTRAVRLVASVDHVNAPAVMWDVTIRSNLAWIWKEVCKCQPYYEEVKVGFNDADFKKSKALSSRRGKGASLGDDDEDANLQHVLTSLAPRHAEALQTLANLQLSSVGGQKPVDYTAWRTVCMNQMVAPDDSALRVYMTELVDHGIIEKRVDENAGTERVWIPHSREKLHEIMGFEVQKSG